MNLELRLPNSEQKLAIEHTGGVLLSAGAGSGKTFVLVEHIIFLFTKFYDETPHDFDEFEKKLKDYFSKIVLMTFTNKAAGELEMRIQSRFDLALERSKANIDSSIPVKYWECAIEALSSLYVGTIHGFCYRLIQQGYIPGLTGTEELINDVDFTRKISLLVDRFFEDETYKESINYYDRLVLNKKNIKKAMAHILSDTDLRVLWNSIGDIEDIHKDQDDYIEKILEEAFSTPLKDLYFDYEASRPSGKKIPAWFTFVEDYHKRREGLLDPIDYLKAMESSLELISQLRKPKSDDPELGIFFEGVKAYRDSVIKPHLKHLVAYKEDSQTLLNWGEDILKIYNFIEEHYLHYKGLTFTDLEFYVWKRLAEEENAKRVGENFNYFIIDEFQDTSKVQFDIVNYIIQNNMKKVFSVGDVKQAIYGFRGGELGVFQNASEKTYQNLSLKNNYRSSAEVIEFNNSLFDFVLPLGEDYEGEDRYSVEMVKQEVPEGISREGLITCHVRNIVVDDDTEKKGWTQTELNKAESHEIAKILASKDPSEEYCILYRKLAPTKFLIPMLVERSVGFSCQVKVDIKEDPFLCLFIEFSRCCAFINDEKSFLSSLRVLKSLIEILKKEKIETLESLMSQIASGEKSLGLLESFKKFLWSIGLSSSNTQNTWPIVQTLSEITGDRSDFIFDHVNALIQGSYSLEFQHGDDNQKIKIMTAHASKGLEFSKVILGGVHTNGGSKGDNVFFGKIPGSYKWIQGIGKSKVFLSPAMIYEQQLKKNKEYSEFKRLFYVATTRAVNELLWIDLSCEGKELSHGKESWVNGIRKFINHSGHPINVHEVDIPYSEIFSENESLSLKPPMFFKDNLGMEFLTGDGASLAIGAELSVTRFASLLHCPRKFVLKNILKITEEEVQVAEEDIVKKEFIDIENDQDVFQKEDMSHKDRGIKVHAAIEHAIKHNFVPKLNDELEAKTQEGVTWIIDELKKFSGEGYHFVSEEPVKFSLFGQMVSGTPDLVLIKDSSLQVWDFKTGKYGEKKARPYWLQLYAYAWAYAQKLDSPDSLSISVTLAFVDEKKLIDKKPSLNEVKDFLFETWSLLENPDQVNTEHCFMCEFQNICSKE